MEHTTHYGCQVIHTSKKGLKFSKRKGKRVRANLWNLFFIDCKVPDSISTPGFTHVQTSSAYSVVIVIGNQYKYCYKMSCKVVLNEGKREQMSGLALRHVISPRMQLPRATSRARFRPIGRAGAREASTAALASLQHALPSCRIFPVQPPASPSLGKTDTSASELSPSLPNRCISWEWLGRNKKKDFSTDIVLRRVRAANGAASFYLWRLIATSCDQLGRRYRKADRFLRWQMIEPVHRCCFLNPRVPVRAKAKKPVLS